MVNLVRASDPEKIETHVAYCEGGELEGPLKRQGAQLYKYARYGHKVKSPATPVIILKLAAYVCRHKIQVVHTHNYSAHVWGSIAARLARAKVVEHVHDPRYEDRAYIRSRGIDSPRQFDQARFFARFSDSIVVLTERNRDQLERWGVKDSKIRVVNNGIPLSAHQGIEREALLKRLSIPEGSNVILAAGRLSAEKNFGAVVEIAASFREGSEKPFFVIAGDGPERETLRKKIRERGLENCVRLIGFYPNVKELLTISRLLIQPSLRELQSLVMLEAMSMGVPVLVSENVGFNDEFITHGKNGFLLDPYKPEDWAEAIRLLLSDPIWAEEVGTNGQSLVESLCDVRETAREFERLYQRLVS